MDFVSEDFHFANQSPITLGLALHFFGLVHFQHPWPPCFYLCCTHCTQPAPLPSPLHPPHGILSTAAPAQTHSACSSMHKLFMAYPHPLLPTHSCPTCIPSANQVHMPHTSLPMHKKRIHALPTTPPITLSHISRYLIN